MIGHVSGKGVSARACVVIVTVDVGLAVRLGTIPALLVIAHTVTGHEISRTRVFIVALLEVGTDAVDAVIQGSVRTAHPIVGRGYGNADTFDALIAGLRAGNDETAGAGIVIVAIRVGLTLVLGLIAHVVLTSEVAEASLGQDVTLSFDASRSGTNQIIESVAVASASAIRAITHRLAGRLTTSSIITTEVAVSGLLRLNTFVLVASGDVTREVSGAETVATARPDDLALLVRVTFRYDVVGVATPGAADFAVVYLFLRFFGTVDGDLGQSAVSLDDVVAVVTGICRLGTSERATEHEKSQTKNSDMELSHEDLRFAQKSAFSIGNNKWDKNP